MGTGELFAGIALLYVLLAGIRLMRPRRREAARLQAGIWLVIAAIFGIVATLLLRQQ